MSEQTPTHTWDASPLFRSIIAPLLVAIIVGGISMYAVSTAQNVRLSTVEKLAQENSRSLRELSALMIDIRLELVRITQGENKFADVHRELAQLNGYFDTIWPRLREMKDHIQKLEAKANSDEEWRH